MNCWNSNEENGVRFSDKKHEVIEYQLYENIKHGLDQFCVTSERSSRKITCGPMIMKVMDFMDINVH